MNKLATLGVASLAVIGVVGAASLSASAVTRPAVHDGNGYSQGRGNGAGRQASLESRAKVVGMTADELETALETKTMSQIAKDKGMTEDQFRAKMQEAAKARWEARGLSAEEIAQRVADREARHAANAADHEWGSGQGDRMGGYGRSR